MYINRDPIAVHYKEIFVIFVTYKFDCNKLTKILQKLAKKVKRDILFQIKSNKYINDYKNDIPLRIYGKEKSQPKCSK